MSALLVAAHELKVEIGDGLEVLRAVLDHVFVRRELEGVDEGGGDGEGSRAAGWVKAGCRASRGSVDGVVVVKCGGDFDDSDPTAPAWTTGSC